MNKKKILIISTIGFNYEGMTSVIYNYTSHIHDETLMFSYTAYADTNPRLMEQFSRLGDIRIVPNRKKDLIGYIWEVSKILSEQYDVIHIHGNSGTMIIEVLLAKCHHIERILVHGHSVSCDHKLIHKLLRFPMSILAADRLACSNEAGRFLFGKRNFTVLNNAVDLSKFTYDWNIRDECRKEFGIKDEFVIGHIGHFSESKNHSFLIDVFAGFSRKVPSARLLLVSDGPKYEEIKRKVTALGLEGKVIFAGRRSDVCRFYQAMDIFVFPSVFEGFGMVLIEAQVSGLPVLVSEHIPERAECTEYFYRMKLESGAAEWAEKIAAIRQIRRNRNENMQQKMRERGFDIIYEAEKLRRMYCM